MNWPKTVKRYWTVLFVFMACQIGFTETIVERWSTSAELNSENIQVWENFKGLMTRTQDAQVTKITVVLEYDPDSLRYNATNVEIYRAGSQQANEVYYFDNPMDVPDNVLEVFLAAKGQEKRTPSPDIWSLPGEYPKFVRELALGLELEEQVEFNREGTLLYVFDESRPEKKKQVLSLLNNELKLNLSLNNNYIIEMLTRPNNGNINIVGIEIKDKNDPNNPIRIDGTELSSLRSQNPAGDILEHIWKQHYRPGSDLDRKVWPNKFDIRFTFRKQGEVFETSRIDVVGIRRGMNSIYTSDKLKGLEQAASANLQGMAHDILMQTNLLGDSITAILTNKYVVNDLPPDGTTGFVKAKENSYAMVSFYSMSIEAFDEQSDYKKTYYDPLNDYNKSVDPNAVYNIFNPGSDVWRKKEEPSLPPKIYTIADTVSSNRLVLGIDKLYTIMNVKNHKIITGASIGQEEFNYPFVYSGSPAFFVNWTFSDGMSNITKIVDNLRFSYRGYSPYLNRFINEYEEAIDTKYTNRNDDINRRISIENIEVAFQKTINLENFYSINIPNISHIIVSVPFQLPVSHSPYYNIGGDKNTIGAASYNNNYTYIKDYKGLALNFVWEQKAGIEFGKYYLKSLGMSYYKVNEVKNNTIQDGRLYSGYFENGQIVYHGDVADKTNLWFFDAQISVPSQDYRFDNFNLKYRLGLGDRVSHMFTTHFKIINGLWWDIKIALYEKDSFAYERVLTFGPVFKIDY